MGNEFSFLLVPGAVVFGLLLGSFLNVCIYRVPRDISVVTPRSSCPVCEKQIAWYDNLPLLSFFVLGGRCRGCRERIPSRYPAVESMTAIAFGVVAYRYGWTGAAFKWAVFESLLIVLFWTDWETEILPHEFTIGGSLAGILFAVFSFVPGLTGEVLLGNCSRQVQSLGNMLIGALLLTVPIWLLGKIMSRIRGQEALGPGDVWLLALIGCFLGPEHGLLAVTIGSVGGSLIGVGMAVATGHKVFGYQVRYGTFLSAGAGLMPLMSVLSGPGMK